MKNFFLTILIHLTFLSLNFLSSCQLFDDYKEKDSLYEWETSSGIQWKVFGDDDKHRKYEGESLNGKPYGLGILRNPSGGKYVGEFKEGLKHGQGTWTHPDGRKYIGEWRQGEFHGKGTINFDNNNSYEGYFKNGQIDGLGTYTWSKHEDQEKYVGEFKDGEIFGVGKMFYKSGQIFEGQMYDNGSYFGKGIKTLPDGSKYEGMWRRNPNDKIHKWGITGYDKNGKVILEISEGKGKGLYVFIDGIKYEGEWKDGNEHGQGTLTFPDGEKYEGEWREGEPWNGKLYDENGNITSKYVNGVKQ